MLKSYAHDLTFAWEYDSNVVELKGFYLYEKDSNHIDYDFNSPVSSLIDGNLRRYTQSGITDGNKSWVLRAMSLYGDFSESSNEISYNIPLVAPSKFNVDGLKANEIVDVIFIDGSSLPGMQVIGYDKDNNIWQFRRPGILIKDFFLPSAAIKAITRKN